MAKSISTQTMEHSPTLNTVHMVEEVLKNADNSIITVAEIKRKLPKQINPAALKTILQALEDKNWIVSSIKGITWVNNSTPASRKAIAQGLEL